MFDERIDFADRRSVVWLIDWLKTKSVFLKHFHETKSMVIENRGGTLKANVVSASTARTSGGVRREDWNTTKEKRHYLTRVMMNGSRRI